MRIKQLQLAGFKSFPQRTVLDIPRGVSGIVGPNGCGKSNIVDAIRWVLGEQSPKHLRGDAMEAVIFNGNERLAPLGMAEVSLTFENDGPSRPPTDLDLEVSTVPAYVRDLPEIMITRRYFRSGESEYFINKTSCRLKDITELFLGTGVGTKAYGIIEQGRVDQLVNAKPEERRLFIEEAAGTTLYRSRKLAAERKMERTRENLARVNDILAEIERSVQYLRRQAKKAEEYRRLQEEVRRLELDLVRTQWERLQAQLQELEESLQRLVETEAAIRQRLEEAEQAHRTAGEAVTAAEHRQARVREQLAVLEAERESARQRLAMLEQERHACERRRSRLLDELDASRNARVEITAGLQRVEAEREQYAQSLIAEERELQELETQLGTARAGAAAAQTHLETAKGTLIEHITREVEVRNALAALERRREDAARQLTKLRAEETALETRLREIEEQRAAGQAELAAMRAQRTATAGEKESRAEQLRALAEQRRRCEREAAELEAAMLQAQSRLDSLEQIQRNYEGYQRGVRAIMREEHHPDGVVGVVAEVIDIPEEYERAVAAVLGDRLQYVIVRSEEAAADAVDLLRQQAGGRGSFIPLDPRRAPINGNGARSVNGSSRRLLDLIRVDSAYRAVAESLLGEVVLVPDLRSAIALWRQNGIRVTLVTPEGDVIDPSGVVTGGSDRPIEEEILARRREIEHLRASVRVSAEDLAEVREAQTRVAEEIDATEQSLRALDEGLHELMMRIVAAEKDLERLELERPQCTSRRDVVRYEIETLLSEDRAAAEQLDEQRQRLAALDLQRQGLERAVTERRAELEQAQQHAEELSGQVTGAKVRVAERRERQQAAAASAEALRRQEIECANRAEKLQADVADAERERDELERAVETARAQEADQMSRRAALQVEVEAAAAELQQLGAAWRQEEQRVRDAQAALETTRNERTQAELSRSELRLRAEHLAESIREKYATNLADHTLGEHVPDPAADAERLEALKVRLGRLGDVNVGAIDELREFEERSSFLRTQRDDLERSLADLERTIQKLNRASRTRFAETFARANEIFQQVFPRLFRGGEARLTLTDENNLLETGVDIIVRPPGKRLDSVALLSGGERALVAVSLIFSLFLINPTPFCILDEVDAPLDDANVGRFNQLVREMSEQSQFILITHNKRTMETADVLYGVTMQEPGVSKVISVAIN